MANQKKSGRKTSFEVFACAVVLILTVIGSAVYLMSFTTNYYTFGQMNSTLITICLAAVIALEIANIILRKKYPDKLWTKYLTYGVTALLAYCAISIIGDRVEAIGTTIMTDYDSGHGGEEAIYYSLGGVALLLIAMIYNIRGSFESSEKKYGAGRRIAAGVIAAVLCVGVAVPVLNLTHVISFGGGSGGKAVASASSTYTVSLNQQNGNVEKDELPDYQFLSNDQGGLLRAESRLYVDITLTLDGNGKYDLFSDCYVIESGKRAVIGDDSGMGLVYTTKAEGSYTENSDGTYTISVPDHAVAEIKTDTYSSQMRSFLSFGDHDEDGVFDSAEVPEVLDFVPETIFTLDKETKAIVTWLNPAEEEEAPAEETPAEEAAPAPASVSIPSDDGGTEMVFNPDGTYVFKFAAYNIEDAGTYTYDNGVLTLTNAAGAEATAEGDPLKLHYVSAVSDQLAGDFTIPADALTFGAAESAAEEMIAKEAPAAEPVTIPSDDGGTEMVFNPDGTYVFKFAAYGIEDAGTYTYENGTLTLTNANGAEAAAEGDPLKLHYVSAVSNQLTGDFTISAETFGK